MMEQLFCGEPAYAPFSLPLPFHVYPASETRLNVGLSVGCETFNCLQIGERVKAADLTGFSVRPLSPVPFANGVDGARDSVMLCTLDEVNPLLIRLSLACASAAIVRLCHTRRPATARAVETLVELAGRHLGPFTPSFGYTPDLMKPGVHVTQLAIARLRKRGSEPHPIREGQECVVKATGETAWCVLNFWAEAFGGTSARYSLFAGKGGAGWSRSEEVAALLSSVVEETREEENSDVRRVGPEAPADRVPDESARTSAVEHGGSNDGGAA